jgi:hypothetical protein
MRVLTTLGAILTVVAGVAGLVFLFAPDVRPCIGDSGASFEDAQVVPGVFYRDHLIREGAPYAEAHKQPNTLGAEIRFTLKTSGYRGKDLPITWSLFHVGSDGILGAVVRGQDRAIGMTVRPEHCGDAGGYDLFIPIPDRDRRYRVMLELFTNSKLNDRLDLVETSVFRN